MNTERLYQGKSAINLNQIDKETKKRVKLAVNDYLQGVLDKSPRDENGIITHFDFNLDNPKLFKSMCYEIKSLLGIKQNYIINTSVIHTMVVSSLNFAGVMNRPKKNEIKTRSAEWKKSVSNFITSLAWTIQKSIKITDMVETISTKNVKQADVKPLINSVVGE